MDGFGMMFVALASYVATYVILVGICVVVGVIGNAIFSLVKKGRWG